MDLDLLLLCVVFINSYERNSSPKSVYYTFFCCYHIVMKITAVISKLLSFLYSNQVSLRICITGDWLHGHSWSYSKACCSFLDSAFLSGFRLGEAPENAGWGPGALQWAPRRHGPGSVRRSHPAYVRNTFGWLFISPSHTRTNMSQRRISRDELKCKQRTINLPLCCLGSVAGSVAS